MRHARHLSSSSTGLETPPWPSVRRGRHFLNASPLEEESPWRVRYGRHFADSLRVDGPRARPSHHWRGTPEISLTRVVDQLPRSLLDVVTAAVDPLEIAAALETRGFSNAVVHDRFGHRDTFTLADQLYSAVEFSPAAATELGRNRPGGVHDLGRGLVFATPTLMFAGAALALRSGLSWWTAPLALVCGWAFSQFVAYLGFSREAVAEPAGATVVWGLVGAVLSCICLGLIGEAVLGGSYVGIVFAVAACAFATAAAALVVRAQERLIALMIIPGALASLVFITGEPFSLPSALIIVLIAASIAGTVAAGLRHVPAMWWRLPVVTRAEAPAAARSFANGCCCGLFLSILVVLQPGASNVHDWGAHNWPAVAAYPMILSLGVMEWQVRSLRAGTRGALSSVYEIAVFPRVVQRKLARATFSYLAVLGLLTAIVRALAYAQQVPVATSLLVASSCLSVAFFLALVVTSYGRVDLVLPAWSAGLGVFGILRLSALVAGRGWPAPDAQFAFVIAALVAAVGLALTARHVVLDPICHG